jgi:hypothetical protein
MSSGLLALACVSSWQIARTSDDNVRDVGDVAQPARAPNSMSTTIRTISWTVANGRGLIVCSFQSGPRAYLSGAYQEVNRTPQNDIENGDFP